VELAIHDERVDLPAHVIHGHVAHQVDVAGVPVHLDHCDVRPERPGAVGRVVVGGLIEERLEALGQVEAQVGRERDLRERLDLVR